MNHIICAILDKAVEAYGRPFVARSHNEAIRTIEIEVNRIAADNMLNTHANDYALYQVGTWDDYTGSILGMDGPPTRMIECNNLLKQ